MQINRPRADRAPSRVGDVGHSKPAEQRSHQEDGRAHFAHQRLRTDVGIEISRPDTESEAPPFLVRDGLNVSPEGTQDLAHDLHVPELGDFPQDALFVCQDSCGHQGEDGVLGRAGYNGPGEGHTPFDDQAFAHLPDPHRRPTAQSSYSLAWVGVTRGRRPGLSASPRRLRACAAGPRRRGTHRRRRW